MSEKIVEKIDEFFAPFVNAKGMSLNDELRNVNFLENGILESVHLVQMIGFLEDELGFYFEDEDFHSEKFVTINGLRELIKNRL